MNRIVLAAVALAAFASVACSNEVDGRQPVSDRTDSAATAQGSSSSNRSSSTDTTKTQAQGQNPTCPEIDVPACASSEELVSGVDEDGCSYAYCKPNACPPIDVPQCAAGQKLTYTTDENGCTFADCE